MKTRTMRSGLVGIEVTVAETGYPEAMPGQPRVAGASARRREVLACKICSRADDCCYPFAGVRSVDCSMHARRLPQSADPFGREKRDTPAPAPARAALFPASPEPGAGRSTVCSCRRPSVLGEQPCEEIRDAIEVGKADGIGKADRAGDFVRVARVSSRRPEGLASDDGRTRDSGLGRPQRCWRHCVVRSLTRSGRCVGPASSRAY